MKKSIKKQYIESLNFIKESKIHIYIIIGIFFAFFLIGFFIPAPEEIAQQIMDFIKEIIEQTKDMDFFELLIFIFLNNLKASFMGLALGIIVGIFPISLALVNGYVIGFVSSMVTKEEGLIALWKLVPHGIFEIPAIFISLGLGLKIGTFIFRKKKTQTFKEYALKSLKAFVLIIIPLLLIAAIIESGFIFILE